MERSEMEIRTALERGALLPWAYIRTLSRVYLGKNPGKVDLNGLTEARFFSENEEIRLFPGQGEWRAVRLAGQEGDETIEECCSISNEIFGRKLTLVRHLEQDEDGQTYVCATRLKNWEGAADDV